jgi:uncharacterized oligopeptide transporter (OPT) family protein
MLIHTRIPAMYGLNLLSTPTQDFGKLVALGVVCGFYGMFFAVPLRKFYILRQRLIFPEATAVSIAIRTLHSSPENARPQIICLSVCFAASFVWKFISDYAPGILSQWNFFYWISLFAGPKILAAHNWTFGQTENSAAMLGIGIIVGLNGALSMYGGAILAWGVLGPITVATGLTAGKKAIVEGYWTYTGGNYGTPRYWLLWPGVLMMICASVTEVLMNYKGLWEGIKLGSIDLYNTIRRRPMSAESSLDDPASPSEQVPIWVSRNVVVLTVRRGDLDF